MQTCIASLLMLFTCCGCAVFSADYRYSQALEKLMGQPVEQAMAILGQPSGQTADYYAWNYNFIARLDDQWVLAAYQQDNLNSDGLKTRVYDELIVPQYLEQRTEKRSCVTRIYLQKDNTISGFNFAGNYCGQWFEQVRKY